MDDVVLVAADVRRQIFSNLEPIVEAALTELDPCARDLVEGGVSCGLLALIQAHPPIVRLVAVGALKAVEFERVPGGIAPELVKATETAIAGFLAAMKPGPAGELVERAVSLRKAGKGGGFVLLVDYTDGEVGVILNLNPKDLSDSVLLGVIADAAPTLAH